MLPQRWTPFSERCTLYGVHHPRSAHVQITATAITLTVDDPFASADFLERTLGFEREMAADGFVSLSRPDAGCNVVYLRTGLETYKPRDRARRTADGVLLAFVVDDVDAEHERLVADGIAILTPPETEEWGERYFQVEDPNGVVVQLVQWGAAPPEGVVAA
jgi:uncharacterized glyoxalase superfamily protein PhnB